jgi:flagellar hook-basal body complex protein FliE
MAPIAPIQSPAAIPGIVSPIGSAGTGTSGAAFGSMLSDAMSKVEQYRENSQQAVDKFLSGEGGEIHDIALSTEKSELAFDMFLQVRNKMVQAYQQVMQMQL